MTTKKISYQRHRVPPEINSHVIWLYHRFCLIFREAEELLAERGVIVTYESMRQWCLSTQTQEAADGEKETVTNQ